MCMCWGCNIYCCVGGGSFQSCHHHHPNPLTHQPQRPVGRVVEERREEGEQVIQGALRAKEEAQGDDPSQQRAAGEAGGGMCGLCVWGGGQRFFWGIFRVLCLWYTTPITMFFDHPFTPRIPLPLTPASCDDEEGDGACCWGPPRAEAGACEWSPPWSCARVRTHPWGCWFVGVRVLSVCLSNISIHNRT